MANVNPFLSGKFTDFVTPPPTAMVELWIDGECFGFFRLEDGSEFDSSDLSYFPVSGNRWINSIELQRDAGDDHVLFNIFYNTEEASFDPQVNHTVDIYFYPAKDSSNIFYAPSNASSSIVPLDIALIEAMRGSINSDYLISDYDFMTIFPMSSSSGGGTT